MADAKLAAARGEDQDFGGIGAETPRDHDFQRRARLAWAGMFALLVAAPFIGIYPVFVMKALCFAIFACAFNLLLGYTGLLSFGHAAFISALGGVCHGLAGAKPGAWSPEFGHALPARWLWQPRLGLDRGA